MNAMVLEKTQGRFIQKRTDIPQVGEKEVKVEIYASGVNPLDVKIWSGNAAHARQTLPAVLGIDLAGKVIEIGNKVSSFRVGDGVFGMTGGIGGVQGSLADFAVVDQDLLAIKPSNFSMRQAAALPLIFITAWEGLVDRAKVDKNNSVLIHFGAGGVGHMAIQIAKAFGAKVFATAAPKDHEIIRSYGAVPVSFEALESGSYIDCYTGGEGFDIIYDTFGGATLDASFKAAKTYTGHVVSSLGWGMHSLAPLSFKGATYSGVFTLLPLLTGKGKAHHGEILKEAARLAENGELTVRLDPHFYTTENIVEAYSAITNRTAKGKVVINIK
jgi:NADPH:quinone reductase-like Zn-dependent oxidoreductase